MKRNESEKLWRQLRRQGFAVERTNGGHVRIARADMAFPVIASASPSDYHGLRNVQAQIRRALKEPLT